MVVHSRHNREFVNHVCRVFRFVLYSVHTVIDTYQLFPTLCIPLKKITIFYCIGHRVIIKMVDVTALDMKTTLAIVYHAKHANLEITRIMHAVELHKQTLYANHVKNVRPVNILSHSVLSTTLTVQTENVKNAKNVVRTLYPNLYPSVLLQLQSYLTCWHHRNRQISRWM